MNPRRKWIERHGRVRRWKRSARGTRFVNQTPPRRYRNLLNRRLRREENRLLRAERYDEFQNRLTRDAAWYW
jgi:hypothetical protein